MIIEQAIDVDLKALSGLTAYTTSSGIFYSDVDQTFSGDGYVTYRRLNSTAGSGRGNTITGVKNAVITINCFHADKFSARYMANVLIEHFEDLRERIGGVTGPIIRYTSVTDNDSGKIEEKFLVTVDVTLIYTE
jgi:hypothetical protein